MRARVDLERLPQSRGPPSEDREGFVAVAPRCGGEWLPAPSLHPLQPLRPGAFLSGCSFLISTWKATSLLETSSQSQITAAFRSLSFRPPGPRCCDFLWFEPLQSLVPACLPAWAPLRLPRALRPSGLAGRKCEVAPQAGCHEEVQEHLPGTSRRNAPLQVPGVPSACWDRGGDRGAGRPTGREGRKRTSWKIPTPGS